MKSYLKFVDLIVTSPRKTRVIEVMSKSKSERLGIIRWEGRWRQYVFSPMESTIWSRGCLQEVKDKLLDLYMERLVPAAATSTTQDVDVDVVTVDSKSNEGISR